MKKEEAMKLIYLFLVHVYCGMIQDSYISLTNGQIISFSNNRNDPRLIMKDYTTNAMIVSAINYNYIWLVKNITGSTYQTLS